MNFAFDSLLAADYVAMNPPRMPWRFAAVFWALFGAISGIQVWIGMISHGHSIPRLVGYYIAVWEAWVLVTAAIVRLARRWPVLPLRRKPLLIHALTACGIGVLHSLYWLALLLMIRPFDWRTPELSEISIADILQDRVPLECLLYAVVLAATTAFELFERYRERELQAAQLEASLADSRLHALELQLQPHFLFNTLNAISSLVRNRRNDEAVTMIAGLSELLRYTLDHSGRPVVSLEEELAVLRRYLEIQRSRFPDRMSFEIDDSPEARRGAVPTLLLQPLAENAVRHGIALSASPGVVKVRAFRSGASLRIEMFNSGTLDASVQGGIGLRNTRERLLHLYGNEGRFDLANAIGGVLASVSIPWSEVPAS